MAHLVVGLGSLLVLEPESRAASFDPSSRHSFIHPFIHNQTIKVMQQQQDNLDHEIETHMLFISHSLDSTVVNHKRRCSLSLSGLDSIVLTSMPSKLLP